MKIVFYTIHSQGSKWASETLNEYASKLNSIIKFEILHLKSLKASRASSEEKKQAEGKEFLKVFQAGDFVIVFDEHGREFKSISFSTEIQKVMNRGPKRLVFVVGGPYGLSEEVLLRAQAKWSLSQLTFNHCIAQVVAVEQIYRAFTILYHLPYHNE